MSRVTPEEWRGFPDDDLALRAIRAEFAATWDVEAFQNNLERYWKRGAGAAKIRWGTKGSHTRCFRQLRKHLGSDDRTHRVCAQWEHDVTGHWPGEKKGKNPAGRG